jgi:hypothetical protein
MKKVLFGCMVLLSACGPIEPDYVDKNGKEYLFTHRCVKSHNESKWEYHYGYNMRNGGFDYHYGLNTKRICDSITTDTIEINRDNKFYTKK